MDSEDIKIQYIPCQKGGQHQGQHINIVCLNPQCQFNPLCCATCVNQQHSAHKTIPLKKLLMQAKQKVKSVQKPQKQQAKKIRGFMDIDTDIIQNIISTSQKQTFQTLRKNKSQIQRNLAQIQESYKKIFYKLQLKAQYQLSQKKGEILVDTAQKIQKSANLSQLLPSLQKGLIVMNSEENNKKIMQSMNSNALYEGILDYNKKVRDTAVESLIKINQNLDQSRKTLQKSFQKLDNIFNKDKLFRFSDQYKSGDIWVPHSCKAVSKKQGIYQVIIMEPQIKKQQQITKFRFQIGKNFSNWVAVGLAYKNIVQKSKFIFTQNIGHGCYLISSNNGSWSNHNTDHNNLKLSFSFQQESIITVIVNTRQKFITFVKQGGEDSLQKQNIVSNIYELDYEDIKDRPLHPCVVFYFSGDQIQYLPVLNDKFHFRYEYQFSQKLKRQGLRIIAKHKILNTCQIQGYRTAILSHSLGHSKHKQMKFAFKIIKTSGWIGLGVCHVKIAQKNKYQFKTNLGHGYYMISSNGGSWSSLDQTKNNKIKTFTFKAGDVITCQVRFCINSNDVNNWIIFKKERQTYQLKFKQIKGDPLHPCVILYYTGDQIAVLPNKFEF